MGCEFGLRDFWERPAWAFKQLLPLRYETTYTRADSVRIKSTWRMWFGRCYDVVEEAVV